MAITLILKKLYAERAKNPHIGSELANKDKLLLALLLAGLFSLSAIDFKLFDLIVSTLSDAYLGVSIFIASTLLFFYTLDNLFKADLAYSLSKHRLLQVPVASFLGALPGCGCAIIVVTQFVNGQMSFGALVAVLISTMGDAAFLLLSQRPEVALKVYSISLAAGIIFGYAINWFHGQDYLKSPPSVAKKVITEVPRLPKSLVYTFLFLLVPGCILGSLEAFQYDSNQLFGMWGANLEPTKWIGFAGSLLCFAIWMSQPLNSWSARFAQKPKNKFLNESVVAETSFVSVWVIFGFLFYELLVYFTGLDLKELFMQLGAFSILFAIAIGLIPGCGPQIVVTTLFINGVIPLAALLANAISNDGDALFPAIALAPGAAIQATVYSTIPAFIIGYGFYYL